MEHTEAQAEKQQQATGTKSTAIILSKYSTFYREGHSFPILALLLILQKKKK